MNRSYERWQTRIEWAVGLLLILYVLLKAFLIPITYDEAYTVERYAHLPFWSIMRSPQAFNLANNHVLNTLLVKVLMHVSRHPFVLRLPNIIAAGLYLYTMRMIGRTLYERWQTAFFLSALLNPMLYEFFALERGYGMSIAFLSFTILQLVLVQKDAPAKRNLHTHLSLASCVLTVYSGLSMLLPVALIFFGVIVVRYTQHESGKLPARIAQTLALPALYASSLCWLIFKPVTYLNRANAFFHGGNTGFFTDTWSSMISDLLGLRPRGFEAFDAGDYASGKLTFYAAATLAIVIAASAFTTYKLIKERDLRGNFLNYLPLYLLTGCIAGINLQFYLLHLRLVNYRVALYLFPLAILVLFSAVKLYSGKYTAFTVRAAWTIALLLVLNFCTQLKITYTTEWPFDAYNDKVCAAVASDHPLQRLGRKAKLYSFVLMQPSCNFYIRTLYAAQIAPIPDIGNVADIEPAHYDYLYLPRNAQTPGPPFSVFRSYENGTYLLYKNYTSSNSGL